MKIAPTHRNYSTAHNIAVFSCLALITSAWATTTGQSYVILTALRNFMFAIHIAAIIFLIIHHRRPLGVFAILAGSMMVYIYSVLMFSLRSSTEVIGIYDYIIFVLLTTSVGGALYLAPPGQQIVSSAVAKLYIFLSIAVVLMTIVVGGLHFNVMPYFVFELTAADQTGLTYSQGVSKFFGLSAVLSSLLFARSSKQKVHSLFYGSLLGIFLVLTLVGGGRGEFLVTLVLCAAAWGSWRLLLVVLATAGVLEFWADEILGLLQYYSNLVFRYEQLSSSLGMRDVLALNGLRLLSENPSCLLFGCGIGFFQQYFGYPPGLYPHNSLLEFLISFGAIGLIAIVAMTFRGLMRVYAVEGRRSHLLFVFVFFLGISLKSGSLITSYLLTGCVAFLVLRGLSIRRHKAMF